MGVRNVRRERHFGANKFDAPGVHHWLRDLRLTPQEQIR